MSVSQGVNIRAPGISIQFPSAQLNRIHEKLEFEFIELKSKLDINQEKYTEKYREWGHWLKLVKKKVERTSNNADIPSVYVLMSNWTSHLEASKPQMLGQVADWFLKQVKNLKYNIEKTQNQILDMYVEKLNKAKEEITQEYQQEKSQWGLMQSWAESLCKDHDLIDKLFKSQIYEKEDKIQ